MTTGVLAQLDIERVLSQTFSGMNDKSEFCPNILHGP